MLYFLFNIIKKYVYAPRFTFLEHALVTITIRIISEPFICASASEGLIGK